MSNVVFFPDGGGHNTSAGTGVFNQPPPAIRTVHGGLDSVSHAGVPMNPYAQMPAHQLHPSYGMDAPAQIAPPAEVAVAPQPQLPAAGATVGPAANQFAKAAWSYADAYAQTVPWYVWLGIGASISFYYTRGGKRVILRNISNL